MPSVAKLSGPGDGLREWTHPVVRRESEGVLVPGRLRDRIRLVCRLSQAADRPPDRATRAFILPVADPHPRTSELTIYDLTVQRERHRPAGRYLAFSGGPTLKARRARVSPDSHT
jgi:hypothetical protein